MPPKRRVRKKKGRSKKKKPKDETPLLKTTPLGEEENDPAACPQSPTLSQRIAMNSPKFGEKLDALRATGFPVGIESTTDISLSSDADSNPSDIDIVLLEEHESKKPSDSQDQQYRLDLNKALEAVISAGPDAEFDIHRIRSDDGKSWSELDSSTDDTMQSHTPRYMEAPGAMSPRGMVEPELSRTSRQRSRRRQKAKRTGTSRSSSTISWRNTKGRPRATRPEIMNRRQKEYQFRPWSPKTDYLLLGSIPRSQDDNPRRIIAFQGKSRAALAFHLGFALHVFRTVPSESVGCVVAEGYGCIVAAALLVAWQKLTEIQHGRGRAMRAFARQIKELSVKAATCEDGLVASVIQQSDWLSNHKAGPGFSITVQGQRNKMVVLAPSTLQGRRFIPILTNMYTGRPHIMGNQSPLGNFYTALYDCVLLQQRAGSRTEVHCSVVDFNGGKGDMEFKAIGTGVGRLSCTVASPRVRQQFQEDMHETNLPIDSIASSNTYQNFPDLLKGLSRRPAMQFELYLTQCCNQETPLLLPVIHKYLDDRIRQGNVKHAPLTSVEVHWLANLGYWRRSQIVKQAAITNQYRSAMKVAPLQESIRDCLARVERSQEKHFRHQDFVVSAEQMPFTRSHALVQKERQQCVSYQSTCTYARTCPATHQDLPVRLTPAHSRKSTPRDRKESHPLVREKRIRHARKLYHAHKPSQDKSCICARLVQAFSRPASRVNTPKGTPKTRSRRLRRKRSSFVK